MMYLLSQDIQTEPIREIMKEIVDVAKKKKERKGGGEGFQDMEKFKS